jgi:putative membrane protein
MTDRQYRPLRTALHLLAVAAAAALGVSASPAQERSRPDPAPKIASDADFVAKAASGGMFEVQSSKLAVGKLTKAEWKTFAEKMIADHSKANDELKAAAAKAGIAVPTALDAHHEKMLTDLKAAPNFDAAYADAQLKAHAEAVALFSAARAGVKDAGLKAFAEKTLPVIQGHYEHAKKHAGPSK